MGMTYQIIAEKDGNRLDLTDDMVFDRECLGTWMGLTCEDYVDFNYKFRVTKEHLDNAITTLQELVDKVSSMPYVDGDGSYTDCQYEDGPDGDYELVFSGPPENVAIMKEVMKVFAREYHYTYPWERRTDTRQERMIQALKSVKEFMETSPGWEVFGLYY